MATIINGTMGDDTLSGSFFLDEVIKGLEGNDTLISYYARDTLEGGEGNDLLIDYGSGILLGGNGIDQFNVKASATFRTTIQDLDIAAGEKVTIEPTEHGFTGYNISLTSNSSGDAVIRMQDVKGFKGYVTLKGVDENDVTIGDLGSGATVEVAWNNADSSTLVGNKHDNTLNGDARDNHIYAGEGDDYVKGHDGDDTIYADNTFSFDPNMIAGNDTVYGGGGNDEIHGGNGADYLNGGDGDDRIFGDSDYEGDQGATLVGGMGSDTLTGGEFSYGGDGDDRIFGDSDYEGDQGATLVGGMGSDTLTGGEFSYGGDGDDVLHSTHGSVLKGGTGNDLLSGSTGSFFGGDGTDSFRFFAISDSNTPASHGRAVVKDFDIDANENLTIIGFPSDFSDTEIVTNSRGDAVIRLNNDDHSKKYYVVLEGIDTSDIALSEQTIDENGLFNIDVITAADAIGSESFSSTESVDSNDIIDPLSGLAGDTDSFIA